MSLTLEESEAKIIRITKVFVEDFLDYNRFRCLDDENDRAAVGVYLASHLLETATELSRAAMGLKE